MRLQKIFYTMCEGTLCILKESSLWGKSVTEKDAIWRIRHVYTRSLDFWAVRVVFLANVGQVGPKSQNWSRQRAWGYSVVKIDLFWCATLGSRRIYHFGSFSGHFGPDSVPVEGHGWVHSNILVAKKWKEAIGLVFEWLPLNELPMNEPLFYARFLLYYLVPFFSY